MHARSGVPQEVMGFLQGKVEGDTFIVLDAVPLPVEVGVLFLDVL